MLVASWPDVYKLNKRGTATGPCGTPAIINDISDKAKPYRTEKCISSR